MKLSGSDARRTPPKMSKRHRVRNEVGQPASLSSLRSLRFGSEWFFPRSRGIHFYQLRPERPSGARTAAPWSSREDHSAERFSNAAEARGATDFFLAGLAFHQGRRQAVALRFATLRL